MAVFGRIAFGCALGFALFAHTDFAAAASDPPRIVIPPRTTNSVICDSRGCFGFGSRQFYTRPGQPLPITPPYTGNANRYNGPRIQIPPREDYRPPRTVVPSPAQQRTRHQMWCAERYRTYNPGTNLYSTIHNGFRTCRSPFD